MKSNVSLNHTLEEYIKKYRIRRYTLLKISKKEVDEYDKKNPIHKKGFLLEGRKWWLIGDTYYEIPKAPRYIWFRNLNGAVQFASCLLLGGVVASAVAVPTILLNKSPAIETKTVTVDSTDVQFSSKFEKDGTLKANIKSSIATKEISKLEIKIGDYVLKENEYTFLKETGEVTISAVIVNAHKGNIVIKPTLVDKSVLVESITISNTIKTVNVEDEIELKATVSPSTAAKKDVTWSIVSGGTGTGEINGNKLKGKSAGTVKIQASATDSSGVKSEVVDFTVTSYAGIDWRYNKFTLDGNARTMYEHAQTAKNIIFKYSESTSGTSIGSTSGKGVYATLENGILTIWSKYTIKFTADDKPTGDGEGYFGRCTNLTSISLDNTDFSFASDFQDMFGGDKLLKELDLSNLVIGSNAVTTQGMFWGCESLTSIKFGEKFNTSTITNMDGMFKQCKALRTLELPTSFKTTNVIHFHEMFAECENLGRIFVSNDFDVSKCTDYGSNMFIGCSCLVGGNNTECSGKGTETGKDYVHIDKEGYPGYFTNTNDKGSLFTKAKLANKIPTFKTAFNYATTIYDKAKVTLESWNDTSTSSEPLTSFEYTAKTGTTDREVKFKSTSTGETACRCDSNFIGDTLLDSLLPETSENVSYEVLKSGVKYVRTDETNDNAIYKLNINKYGYIEELIIKGDSPISYSLKYDGAPEDAGEQITLNYYQQCPYKYMSDDTFTLKVNTKYTFKVSVVDAAKPTRFALKRETGNVLVYLNDFIIPPNSGEKSPTIDGNYITDGIQGHNLVFNSLSAGDHVLTFYTKASGMEPGVVAYAIMHTNWIN